jgi:hypothetical protein
MRKYPKKLQDSLDAAGARVVRHKKHIVYALANGRMVVISSTPSDVNSYKKALSDIRRAAAIPSPKELFPSLSRPEPASAGSKARFHPPVRDQVLSQEPAFIFSSERSGGVQLSSGPKEKVRFRSVSELISVVDDVESFWNLNADGRTRVLKKLAGEFAEADVIGTRSHKTSFKGFEWYMAKFDRHDPLLALWGFDWQMPITRSLCIKTDDGQVQILETESKRFLEGTAQICVILPAKSDADMEERAEIETIGESAEPELNQFVFHHFISESKMRSRNLHFETSHEWLDPRVVRPVISEMLEVLAERRAKETSSVPR